MKKYPFLVLFFVVFASAQTYEFDYKCYNPEKQTRGNYKGVKRTNIIYLSSKESDIIAYDYSFSKEPKRSFYFYDFKNNFFSYYTLNNESDLSSLKFVNSDSIRVFDDEKLIERVTVNKISENVFVLKAFPNEKTKRANLELKIVVEKNDFPMRRIRFMDLTLNIHDKIYDALLNELGSKDYRIIDVITDYKNGVIMHDDFSKCEKVNLKFVVKP